MRATLTICDETTAGTSEHRFTLEFPTERITVRELIRERVYQEARRPVTTQSPHHFYWRP